MTIYHQSAQRHSDQPRPSDDAIEAIIQQATTSSRQERGPLRDTRTQLYVGNLPYRVRWQDLKDLFRKAGTVLRADVSLGPDNRSRGYGTVVLATAEDAGRAVDIFNGYTWQTRVLEVRLDRLIPEYEMMPIGTATMPSTSAGPGGGLGTSVATTGATGSAQYSLHMTMGTGGSAGGAPYVGMSGSLAALGSASGAGASTNQFVPNSAICSATSPLATSFASFRPPSSSAPSQDPLDILHSSTSASNALNFQTPDPNANRTLFVGNLPFHIQWQDLKDLFRKAGTILRADVALGPDNRSRGFGTVVFATDADADRAIQMFNGYEHNGRVLKVHYDKFSSTTASHGLTTSSLAQHQQQHASASASLHSSPFSTAVHSTTSSPRPAHAHAQLSSSLPSGLHTLTRSSNGPPVSSTLYQRLGQAPQVQLQPHVHAQQIQQQHQQHPGSITLPPGFLYDYGPSSGPSSPYEMMQLQQQLADQGYFESIYGGTHHHHHHQQQQLGYERQQRERERQLDAQLRERDAQWELEMSRLHQQQLLQQQREREHERVWERDRPNQRQHHEGLLSSASKSASVSTSALDIESLSSSLTSMRFPTSASASMTGLSYGYGQGPGISISPPSVSVSTSVSASASASVSAPSPTSTSNSNPNSTNSSKPPSTKPIVSAVTPAVHMLPPFASSSSLPLHLDNVDRSAGSGSRKASSSIGVATGGYDKANELHPPPISTHTSTSSSSFISMVGGDELTQASSPFLDVHSIQELASGRGSRSSHGAVSAWGSGRSSRVGYREGEEAEDDDDTRDRERQNTGSSSTSNQGGHQQRQIPYHPGPISMPPPIAFNSTQMPIMPLTTMTPGHAPHVQLQTPQATMTMMNSNMSPLYHPAHTAAMAAMAAAAAHGGGSPSPFGIYPGSAAFAGAGMINSTPLGLPAITPGMPPFTFLPQHYMPAGASSGAVGNERVEGGSRQERRDGEGNPVAPGASEGVAGGPGQDQQSPHSLRLNLATVPGGFSPGVTMSPGTFYGRPGNVPGQNPFINAAVGAPVHPVVPHPAMHSPVQTHPAYHHHHHARGYDIGLPHGGYFYGVSSPMRAPSSGMDPPQGYFDPKYFPAGVGGTGYAGASATGESRSERAETGKETTDPPPEVTSPQDDLASFNSSLTAATSDEQYGDAEDGDNGNDDNDDEGVVGPSRTRSDGHTRESSVALRERGRDRARLAVHRSESDPAS